MFESVSAAQTKAHHIFFILNDTDVPLKARCNKNTKQCLYYYLIEKSGSPEPVVSCSAVPGDQLITFSCISLACVATDLSLQER